MTTPTSTTSTTGPSSDQAGPTAEDFTTSEGLRALLNRLHEGGEDAWVHDPVARALMEFAAEKYASLARKHKLDTWEAVTAAFNAMQYRSTREADDPWATITHAVRITCVYEERAQGLLCSVHQARRAHFSSFHDPERFSDRENPLSEYHPAFQVSDIHSDDDTEPDVARMVNAAVQDAITLFTLLGWPEGTARAAVGFVCESLERLGSRATTYEALRRDRHARALLDVPAGSWTALLRVLLGSADAAYGATHRGQGILRRLLTGNDLAQLLADDHLVAMICLTAPGTQGRQRGA
jgi:hypothetical protein